MTNTDISVPQQNLTDTQDQEDDRQILVNNEIETDRQSLVDNEQEIDRQSENISSENLPETGRLIRILNRIPLCGFWLVLLACFVMTLAGVMVKVLTDIDPFVLTGYRNAIIFILSAIRLAVFRISPEPEGKRRYLVTRAVFVAIFSAALFYSFRHLPLGEIMYK